MPVHDEDVVLVESIGRLHGYLSVAFPFPWRVTNLAAMRAGAACPPGFP